MPPSRRRVLVTAAGLGLLLGGLGAFGWHLQPSSGAIFSIFGAGTGGPTREQLADWTDHWRPLWWPVVLGFPAAALLAATVLGWLVAPLLTRPHAGAGRGAWVVLPTLTLGSLGLVLGALGAVGWHYHPFVLREPPPLLFSTRTDAEREQLVEMIQAGPFGDRVDDWADLWWPAVLTYPLLAALLGLAAGLTLRHRQPPPPLSTRADVR